MKLETHYTICQLAKVLQIDYRTLNREVERNAIPFTTHPITGRKLFRKEIIDKKYNLQPTN